MKKQIIIFMLTFFSVSFIFGQEKQRNNIIIFDITGSMVGMPIGSGNHDIWKPSLNLLKKQLNSFPDNENIIFYVFGEKLIYVDNFNKGNNTTNNIIKIVNSYRQNNMLESWTCIYKSLNEVIKNLDTTTTNTIYLFTDGKNSYGHNSCGSIKPLDIVNKWESFSKENEYLYIFKLKTFNLPSTLDNSPKVEVIGDALNNFIVNIEPINNSIKISRKSMTSTQRFRITGAGINDVPSDLTVKASDILFDSNTATVQPNEFKVKKPKQEFSIAIDNKIENIEQKIFIGELDYSFKDGTKKIHWNDKNTKLTISLKNSTVKVIFNNKKEEPHVTIEFVD